MMYCITCVCIPGATLEVVEQAISVEESAGSVLVCIELAEDVVEIERNVVINATIDPGKKKKQH